MSDLAQLADLLRQRNAIDARIAALINRPANTGHLGEYIASRIFDIALMPSASNKAIDGYFASGPLAGCSVNIKSYSQRNGLLDLSPDSQPDFILVLAGPKSAAVSSRGQMRPFVIDSVFLFDAAALVASLTTNIGIATSVRQVLWDKTEIYPTRRNPILALSDEQRAMLALFSSSYGH